MYFSRTVILKVTCLGVGQRFTWAGLGVTHPNKSPCGDLQGILSRISWKRVLKKRQDVAREIMYCKFWVSAECLRFCGRGIGEWKSRKLGGFDQIRWWSLTLHPTLYIFINIYTYIHTYINFICIYVYMYIHVYIFMHIYIYVYIYVCVCNM